MNKNELNNFFSILASDTSYNWSIYGILHSKAKGSNKSYSTMKIKFNDENKLKEYKNNLIKNFIDYVLPKRDEISSYNGYNPKISLDSIDISDPKVKENVKKLSSSIIHFNEDLKLEDCNAYVLIGKNDINTVFFIKKAKPTMNTKKKSSVFLSETNILKEIRNSIFRFYYNFDCVIINQTMYCLNIEFESLFGIDNTIRLIQKKHINDIKNSNLINKEDVENYLSYANASARARKFLKYDENELERMNNLTYRKSVAKKLGIKLSQDNKFILETEENHEMLTQHLCGNITRNLMDEELYYVTNKQLVSN